MSEYLDLCCFDRLIGAKCLFTSLFWLALVMASGESLSWIRIRMACQEDKKIESVCILNRYNEKKTCSHTYRV